MAVTPTKFLVLVYRMPTKPTAGRVAVWRLLKKAGAVYLQDSVCVFPDLTRVRRELEPVLERIDEKRGSYHLLPLRKLDEEEAEKIIALFRDQASKHYLEIVEDCEVNFVKEIEKLGTWFDRVQDRDWFDAPHRTEARDWLKRCERMLEGFEAKVFERHGKGEAKDGDAKTRLRALPSVHDSAAANEA